MSYGVIDWTTPNLHGCCKLENRVKPGAKTKPNAKAAKELPHSKVSGCAGEKKETGLYPGGTLECGNYLPLSHLGDSQLPDNESPQTARVKPDAETKPNAKAAKELPHSKVSGCAGEKKETGLYPGGTLECGNYLPLSHLGDSQLPDNGSPQTARVKPDAETKPNAKAAKELPHSKVSGCAGGAACESVRLCLWNCPCSPREIFGACLLHRSITQVHWKVKSA